MTSKLRIFALLGSTALLASACTLKLGEGDGIDNGDSSFGDDDFDDESSSDVGTGSGTGGAGGAETVGSSGTGGSSLSCTPPEGYGPSVSECDVMPTSPSNTDATCDGYDPLPYLSCNRAFEIYNPGQAEQLANCLATIDEVDACNDTPVADCVTEMYDDACESDYIIESCQIFADACADAGEVLDQAQCAADLNPMNEDAVGELVDCMNAIDDTCQARYDICFEELITL